MILNETTNVWNHPMFQDDYCYKIKLLGMRYIGAHIEFLLYSHGFYYLLDTTEQLTDCFIPIIALKLFAFETKDDLLQYLKDTEKEETINAIKQHMKEYAYGEPPYWYTTDPLFLTINLQRGPGEDRMETEVFLIHNEYGHNWTRNVDTSLLQGGFIEDLVCHIY